MSGSLEATRFTRRTRGAHTQPALSVECGFRGVTTEVRGESPITDIRSLPKTETRTCSTA